MLNPLALFWRPGHSDPDAFSPDEVLAILRGQDLDERGQAALEVISQPTTWLPPDHGEAFGTLTWYAERLPTIFHLYRRGWAPEQIGRRLTPLGGGWAVSETLTIAADLIARRLNGQGRALAA